MADAEDVTAAHEEQEEYDEENPLNEEEDAPEGGASEAPNGLENGNTDHTEDQPADQDDKGDAGGGAGAEEDKAVEGGPKVPHGEDKATTEAAGEEANDDNDPLKLPPVGTEIFLGNVPHAATREEIQEFCERVAPLHKLHVPPPKSQGSNNQGYAFAMYKTRVAAAEAIEQLSGEFMPSGPGRRLTIKYAAKKRNKLYVCNIPKDFTRDRLTEAFGAIVEGIMDVDAMPMRDGRPGEHNRGFCFLEMYNGPAAERAIAKLSSTDQDFGGQRLVPPLRVEWADAKNEGDETEVKAIHISHLPDEIDEEKLRQAFEPLAPIERIALLERREPRQGESKYRDYAFIHYEKRSTALKVFEACFESPVTIEGARVHVAMAKPVIRPDGPDRGPRMDRGPRGGAEFGRSGPGPRFDGYDGRGPPRDFDRRGPPRDMYDRRDHRDYDGGPRYGGPPPGRGGGYGDDGYGGYGRGPPRRDSWDGGMAPMPGMMPAQGIMPVPFMMMPGMMPPQGAAGMAGAPPGGPAEREKPATGGYGAARGGSSTGLPRNYGGGQRYAPY